MRVRMYTDGACSGNPGPGGWAVVYTLPTGHKTLSGRDCATTNNRMELTAAVQALEHLSVVPWARNVDCIDLHSDSAYVVNAINNKWLQGWRKNNWLTQQGKSVKNKDLWEALSRILQKMAQGSVEVNFIKVKGHAGNTFNEMVDQLAVSESVKAQRELNEK